MVAKPGSANLHEFTVACPRSQVFDHALSFAQRRNLEVKVLEKSSGLIRFETTTLSAGSLDQYCVFPLVSSRDNLPTHTYEAWASEYAGVVVGTVSLNLLLSEDGPASTKVSIRGNWSVVMTGDGSRYSGPVSSNGFLEDELRRYLEGQQACSANAPASNAEKLEELRRLKDKGLITPAEFQRKQKELAGS
jgi:hypothetical protein